MPGTRYKCDAQERGVGVPEPHLGRSTALWARCLRQALSLCKLLCPCFSGAGFLWFSLRFQYHFPWLPFQPS